MTYSSVDAHSSTSDASDSFAMRIVHAGSPPFVQGTVFVNAPMERTSTVRHAGAAA